MLAAAQPDPSRGLDPGAVSFLAAAEALEAIDAAVRTARTAGEAPSSSRAEREQVLASLLLLREVREQLAGWETSLIETAREAGASWADLAGPLGVASRQAAERRYLRLRPGAHGTTGEQRVKATRDSRAADRTISAWARANAADLRTLAEQITVLADLPAAARATLGELRQALADDDAARLVSPLAAIRIHLGAGHSDLGERIDCLTRHTVRLRQDTTTRRQDT